MSLFEELVKSFSANPPPALKDTTTKSHHSAIKTLLDEVAALRAAVGKLESEKVALKQEIDILKKAQATSAPALSLASAAVSSQVCDSSTILKSMISSEISEARRVEKNVVIRGLPERENGDDLAVEELLDAIGVNKIVVKRTKRLKRASPGTSTNGEQRSPCPVIVELENVTARDEIVNKASRLKVHGQFRTVYISRDRTRTERAADAELRRQRNEKNASLPFERGDGLRYDRRDDGTEFFWSIRSGRLVETTRKIIN